MVGPRREAAMRAARAMGDRMRRRIGQDGPEDDSDRAARTRCAGGSGAEADLCE